MGRWTRKPPYGTPIDPGHDLAPGLKAFLPFNEAAGPYAFDASPSGLTLAWQEPSVAWGLAPPSGPIGTFPDATNYGAAGTVFSSSHAFTVAFRIATAQASTASATGLLSLGSTSGSGNPLYLFNQNGTMLRALAADAAYQTIVAAAVPNQFYTISSSWDTATESHYLNGLLVYSGARTAGILTAPFKLWVGTGFSAIGKGAIDWVGVWDRSLPGALQVAMGADPGFVWGLFAPEEDPLLIYPGASRVAHNLALLGCGR